MTTGLVTASPAPLTACPTIVFSFEDRNTNGAIDAPIFTYDPSSLIFRTASSDITDANTYQMRLIANYDGLTNTEPLDFDVVLFDACTTSTIIVNPGVLQS